ncbi:MAG: thioredoxin domain-containing protein [Candidatus Acidiferrales bacterium]
MRKKTDWLFLLVFACGLQASDLQTVAPPPKCNTTALSAAKKQALAQYILRRYKLQGSTSVRVIGEHLDPRTCYRKLKFEGKNAFRTWDLTLYLSPDERFLSSEVFDTTLDPVAEERREEQAMMSDLAQNKGASKGLANAPVTIVEFADFECPFCGKLENVFKQVLPEEKGKVRIVFHHLPLRMHPWARAAAEGAACAQLQNADAFWSMHDQLFEHQADITAKNIHQKLLGFAKATKSLNLQEFQNCLDNQMSLGLVLRDLNLASDNHINATPTLFINGKRVQGVQDANELMQLIGEAAKEAPATKITASSSSGESARSALKTTPY